MLPPLANQRRRPPMLGFFILSIGLGICLYYGMEWYELPVYTEAEIDQSTELNLQMDLQRMGPLLRPKTPDDLAVMRAKLRYEITDSIKQQNDKVHLRFSVGLIALIIGIGQLMSSWLIRRRFR
jgi:hypothetical protein